jgi:amino acid transporter
MMAADGNFPKFFMRTNKRGTPYIAVAISMLFCCLAFTATTTNAYKVFRYFVSAVTLTSTLVWMGIYWSHISWRRACKLQGVNLSTLPYRNRFAVFLSWWGLIGTGVISLTKGFDAFIGGFNTVNFITHYGEFVNTPLWLIHTVSLPVSIIAYIIYGLKYHEWYIPASKVDLDSDIREYDDNEVEDPQDVRKPGVLGWIRYAWNS